MRSWLVVALVVAVPALARASEPPLPDYGPPVTNSPEGTVTKQRPARAAHPNPRVKLSFRRFSINGPDGNPIALDGGQIDAYAVSRRWFRLGLEAEGGAARTNDVLANTAGHVWYGLTGLTMAVQYPARVTPFVEGRVAIGVLGGTLSGSTVANGQTYTAKGFSAATFMYLYGVDVGVELYAIGRTYLSLAVGWARPTYLGVSIADVVAIAGGATPKSRFLADDTFTFKVGLGF